MLWYNTQIIVDNDNISINDNDECMTKNKNKNNFNEDCNENGFDLDDLWFAAGKTMELPPTPIKDDEKQCEEEDVDEEQEEEQQEQELGDGEEGKINHTQHVISRIISDLISIPFDEQPLNPNVHKTMNKSTSITSSCSTLSVPRCDIADGTTTRSSSFGSEADIKINYSSSNVLYQNEPSISLSYIVDDANTPIPPNEPTNTSALYEFLFDGVDTDSDDDVFGTSFIEMNQRKSIPFEVKMVKMGGARIDGANCSNNTDTKDLSNTSDNKEEEEQEGQSELEENNKLQHDKPETYVPCRPLWELIK